MKPKGAFNYKNYITVSVEKPAEKLYTLLTKQQLTRYADSVQT